MASRRLRGTSKGGFSTSAPPITSRHATRMKRTDANSCSKTRGSVSARRDTPMGRLDEE